VSALDAGETRRAIARTAASPDAAALRDVDGRGAAADGVVADNASHRAIDREEALEASSVCKYYGVT
jgi:hypothetical protein